jgi:hypothetical protein
MLAAEQGVPQDLICLPSMPPQDVISLEEGAGQETQQNNKEEEIYRSDSEV